MNSTLLLIGLGTLVAVGTLVVLGKMIWEDTLRRVREAQEPIPDRDDRDSLDSEQTQTPRASFPEYAPVSGESTETAIR